MVCFQQFSLLRIFSSIFFFGVRADECLQQNSVRLKEVQMFAYTSVNVN